MPADPQRIQAIFLQAVEAADAAARAQLLERECGANAELRQRVETLLQAHDAASVFVDKPAVCSASTVDEPRLSEAPGTRIGPYKLLQQLGEGGMGVVFLAEQLEPVQRKVALKVIKPGMDTRQVVARFEAERQALALMDHPNIARVLDAGATDSGRPYFVMELVKGLPITKYCDQEHLTPQERLHLFVPICHAVQHAHQKGIIHRDLKPSNILIALYDGRPVPKVIDFGVAKATGTKLTEHTLFTEVGHAIGTWEYMAPEQAELNNLDIDTRADIYALGATLYELLAGSPPFTRQQFRNAAFEEMLRMIREVEPPKPSTKLSSSDELPSLAAKRKLEPAKLSRLVRGDLDWIVMKCLEKERGRRYETANGLAMDVQRYLADEAVLASPPSTAYRLRKFVRRHRPQVIAAGLLLFVLVAGIVGTTVGLVAAQRAREAEAERADGERRATIDADAKRIEAERQQKRALAGEKLAEERLKQLELEKKQVETERKIAQAVRDFLQHKLLGQADTSNQADALLRSGGAAAQAKLNPTIRELLDRAAEELAATTIEANFPNQPLLQAELLHTVGATYRRIGEAKLAVKYLLRALALRRQHQGPDHLDTLSTANELAAGYQFAGLLDKAMPLFEENVELATAKRGADHSDTLAHMVNLAQCYRNAGQLKKALPLFNETLKLMKAKLGAAHPLTLICMNNLALCYDSAGQMDKALPLYEETLKREKASRGADHPGTLITMDNLAGGYVVVGQVEKGLALFKETLELKKAKFGADHPRTLVTMHNLAWAYYKAGKKTEGLTMYDQVFKLRKAKLGPDHPHTLTSMFGLIIGYQGARQYDKALPFLKEVLEVRKDKLGPNHRDTLNSMNELAVTYWFLKQLDKSIPLLEEALKRQEATLGRDHADTRRTAANLGVNYRDAAGIKATTGLALLARKQWTDAEPILRECLALREKIQPDDWSTFNTQSMLGGALSGQKRYADAEPLLLKGYQGMKAREKTIPPQGRLRIPEALDRLIELYTALNKPDEAKKWRAERAKYPRSKSKSEEKK